MAYPERKSGPMDRAQEGWAFYDYVADRQAESRKRGINVTTKNGYLSPTVLVEWAQDYLGVVAWADGWTAEEFATAYRSIVATENAKKRKINRAKKARSDEQEQKKQRRKDFEAAQGKLEL